jgi:hypothetical protein
MDIFVCESLLKPRNSNGAPTTYFMSIMGKDTRKDFISGNSEVAGRVKMWINFHRDILVLAHVLILPHQLLTRGYNMGGLNQYHHKPYLALTIFIPCIWSSVYYGPRVRYERLRRIGGEKLVAQYKSNDGGGRGKVVEVGVSQLGVATTKTSTTITII